MKTDEELVQNVQQGGAGFDELYRRYEEKVKQIVYKYCDNREDIEDVASEVWLKVHRHIDKFKFKSTFYTWIYRISINAAKNHLTTKSRKLPSTLRDPDDDHEIDNADPSNELFEDEVQLILQDAIKSLPRPLYDALVLRDIRGMSYSEIATECNCKVGTCKSRVHRARNIVDRKLHPHVRRKRIE